MADFTSLKQTIQSYVKQNGNEEITGNILQDVLLAMVSTMGDSAINGLVSALQDETTARQNQDGTLQGNITAETTARQQAETALGGRIDGLQTAINGINTKMAEGYIYAGIATPSTNPGTPSGKVFYIAVSSGTYTNFSNLTVAQGINILKYNGSSWSKDVVYAIDARPKKESQNLVTSGGVFDNIGALDVSELNATENPHTLAQYADLSAALAAIPTDYQKGGMSIKYVQTSDNKYVRFDLMTQDFTTDVSAWRGVDSEVKAGSKNLVENGSVAEYLKRIDKVELSITEYGKYISLSGGVGSEAPVNNPTISSAYHYILYPVKERDLIIINGVGGKASRLWAFLDSSNIILEVATSDVVAEDLELVVPRNASFVVINSATNGSCYIDSTYDLHEYPHTPIELLLHNIIENGYINAEGNWTSGTNTSIIEPVIANGVYEIQSNQSRNAVYAFLSDLPAFISGVPVSFANGYNSIQSIEVGGKKELRAPSNAKYIYVLGGKYKPISVKLISYSWYSEPHQPYIYNLGLYDKINGIIGNTGKWAVLSGYSSIFIPCVNNGVYKIKANPNSIAVFAFLTELPTFVEGEDVSFAEGSSRTVIEANNNVEVSSPVDAKYLYLFGGTNLPELVELVAYSYDSNYNYHNDYPIIPNDIFVLDNWPTPIFKKSLFKSPYNAQDLVLTTMVNSRLKCLEVGEPLNIDYDKVGSVATLTIEKKSTPTINLFKNINIHKKSLSELSGKTSKILMIGDSLTHGNHGAQSSPIVKVNELLSSRYNVTPIMIGTFSPFEVNGEGRGCFSYEAMVGSNNNPFGSYHFTSVGGDLEINHSTTTTQFQNPFTFPATAEDKENHPEWCFTNNNNYPGETDGVSYAEASAEQKTNWHFFIFDFARYLALWNDTAHIPDIITIALGTNDWQPSGVMSIPDIMFAFGIIYSQVRLALPNVKIGIVSSQNCAITLQDSMTVSGGAINGNFPDEIAPLITNIQKQIRVYNTGGDNKIFEIPLYACGSRWLAFDGHVASASQDISQDNNVQERTINTNVHLLDGVGSDGYWQYIDGIITAIACMVS